MLIYQRVDGELATGLKKIDPSHDLHIIYIPQDRYP